MGGPFLTNGRGGGSRRAYQGVQNTLLTSLNPDRGSLRSLRDTEFEAVFSTYFTVESFAVAHYRRFSSICYQEPLSCPSPNVKKTHFSFGIDTRTVEFRLPFCGGWFSIRYNPSGRRQGGYHFRFGRFPEEC